MQSGNELKDVSTVQKRHIYQASNHLLQLMDAATKPANDRAQMEKGVAGSQKLRLEQAIVLSPAQQREETTQLGQQWINSDQQHQTFTRDANRNNDHELKGITAPGGIIGHNELDGMSKLNQVREEMLEKCELALDEVGSTRSDHSQQSKDYDVHLNSDRGDSPAGEREQTYTREQTRAREIEHIYELIR